MPAGVGERRSAGGLNMIDLTRPLSDGMTVFPGHPAVEIDRILTVPHDGRNVESIRMGSHAGTHLDLPFHYVDSGPTAEDAILTAICGPALLLDWSANGSRPITVADLEAHHDKIHRLKKIVLRTDWNAEGDEYFLDYPVFSLQAVEWLCDLKIEMLGMDTPSPGPCNPEGKTIHAKLLNSGIHIIEGLTNLKRISNKMFFLMCLPLYLKGTGGAPSRAVALLKTSEIRTHEI